MAFNRYKTALAIVRTAMSRCDMEKPTSLTTAPDDTTLKFVDLLNFVGQQICESFPWQKMQKVWNFTTTGTLEYGLPADFDRFVNDTEWNRTTRLPISGPLNPQQWQTIVARGLGATTFQLHYKFENDKVVFYSEPSGSPQNLSFMYHTRGWVLDADDSATLKDEVVKDNDVILLPPLLVAVGIVLKWKQDRGFDTTAVQNEFDALAATGTAKDGPAYTQILGRTNGSTPLLGTANIPITNFGS